MWSLVHLFLTRVNKKLYESFSDTFLTYFINWVKVPIHNVDILSELVNYLHNPDILYELGKSTYITLTYFLNWL